MKTTTKFFSLLFISVLFCLASCSKDDNDANSLIGKWEVVSYIGDDETDLHEHACDSKKDYWEFSSNNTVRAGYHDSDCTVEIDGPVSYSVSGNKISIDGEDPVTFSISGNELTLGSDGEFMKLRKM